MVAIRDLASIIFIVATVLVVDIFVTTLVLYRQFCNVAITSTITDDLTDLDIRDIDGSYIISCRRMSTVIHGRLDTVLEDHLECCHTTTWIAFRLDGL